MIKKILNSTASIALATSLSFTGCSDKQNNDTNTEGDNKVKQSDNYSISQAKSSLRILKTSFVDSKINGGNPNAADIMLASFTNQSVREGLSKEVYGDLTDSELFENVVRDIKNPSNVKGSSSLSSSSMAPSRSRFLDKLKEKLVTTMDTKTGQILMSGSFSLVLDDIGLTKFMIEQAIKSETMTKLMVDALKDDPDLMIKMEPFLKEDKEFGELFTELALVRPSVATLSFEMISPSLYDAITQSMMLSKKTTVNMSSMMKRDSLKYLVVPGTGIDGDYGKTDTFSSLFFNSNYEAANQRFFYTMFMYSESTANFVDAFKEVRSKDGSVSTTFLNQVFLGEDLNGVEDVNLSYRNIYAIAGGMYSGLENEGFNNYKDSFIGFATLVDIDKFLPYGKRFYSAGVAYGVANGYDYTDFGRLVTDVMFSSDDVDTSASSQKAPSLKSAIREGSDDTLIEDLIWYYEQLGVKAIEFKDWAIDGTLNITHDYLETQAQEFLEDSNFTLPDIMDLNRTYFYDQSMTYVNYVQNNPGEALYEFSEYEYVNYVYGYGEYLDTFTYIPTWMTKKDWLKVPNTYENQKVVFNGSAVEFYLISKESNVTKVENIIGVSPITKINETLVMTNDNNESYDVYVYKVVSYDSVNIDFGTLSTYFEGMFTD